MSPEAGPKLTDLLLQLDQTRHLEHGNAHPTPHLLVVDLASRLRVADRELYEHSVRVASWARRTAVRLGFAPRRLLVLELAALFHDIGKLPFLALVRKPGSLSGKEWELLTAHPELGARLLYVLGPPFRPAAPYVRAHHRRYDEDGKPQLLGARVIAVADAYDAMVVPRPYREAVSPTVALEEILRQSGRQFDPAVVSAFLELDELRPTTALPGA